MVPTPAPISTGVGTSQFLIRFDEDSGWVFTPWDFETSAPLST
jgi:hypothetical protein